MKFKEYTEIQNHTNKFVRELPEQIKELTWVALNKVDGGNFSIWYDGNELRLAKRTSIITDDSTFGNSNIIMKQYHDATKKVYDIIKQPFTIYGEIFGGYYPHVIVERVKDAQKIQGRVSYCPHNDFIGYDIYIHETKNYLDWDDVRNILTSCGFKVVDEITRGTFDDMMNLNVVFNDPTYKQYNLPMIDNNFSEGVVIKPLHEQRNTFGNRVIFKKKNEKFAENKEVKKEVVEIELSDEEQNALNLLMSLITESRYYSVVSKITTEPTFKMFSQIQKEFCHDVINDFEKENEKSLYDYENHKVFTKKLGENCAYIVRKELMKDL